MLSSHDQCMTSSVSPLSARIHPSSFPLPTRIIEESQPFLSSVRGAVFSSTLHTFWKMPLNLGDEEFLQIHIFHTPSLPFPAFQPPFSALLSPPSPHRLPTLSSAAPLTCGFHTDRRRHLLEVGNPAVRS